VQLKGLIVRGVAKFHAEQGYDTLSEQVLFSVVGAHFRELLEFEEKFEPQTLREPFLLNSELEYLYESIHRNLVTEVTAIVLSTRHGNYGSLNLYKLSPLVDHLLGFYREKWKDNVFFLAEVIGSTLLRTMHRSQYKIVHDIVSPENMPQEPPPQAQPESSRATDAQSAAAVDNDSLLNSYHRSQDSISQVYSLGLTSKDDYVKLFRRMAGVSDEVADILDTFSPVTMDSICDRIVGSLLCNSMRVAVWSYRFLNRPADRVVEPNHFVAELSRLGACKEFGVASRNTPVSNTVTQYIQRCIEIGFPIWRRENSTNSHVATAATATATSDAASTGDSPRDRVGSSSAAPSAGAASGTVLARRAEHLVNAIYVLTGVISERGVMLSLLLLRVFHTESPVSEKILRMYSKAVEDFLPSDHPNSKYSMIYTNNLIWHSVKLEDPELFGHMREYLQEDPDEGDDLLTAAVPQQWNKAFGGIFKEGRKEMPMGMPLVKGWLDTGFIGWLPEFGVIFIWDQLALLGGAPSQNQRFIVRLCVQLLKHFRQPLLDSKKMFPSKLRECGRGLRSKEVFHITCETLVLYTEDIPPEERLENEAAKSRAATLTVQRACRGYLARLRARLIRRAKEGGETDSYVNDKGDFHSIQWMRKLSLAADRSQAYQLAELSKFNAMSAGRSVLRMANSRSECLIDVYGPADEVPQRGRGGGIALPVLAPSSSRRHTDTDRDRDTQGQDASVDGAGAGAGAGAADDSGSVGSGGSGRAVTDAAVDTTVVDTAGADAAVDAAMGNAAAVADSGKAAPAPGADPSPEPSAGAGEKAGLEAGGEAASVSVPTGAEEAVDDASADVNDTNAIASEEVSAVEGDSKGEGEGEGESVTAAAAEEGAGAGAAADAQPAEDPPPDTGAAEPEAAADAPPAPAPAAEDPPPEPGSSDGSATAEPTADPIADPAPGPPTVDPAAAASSDKGGSKEGTEVDPTEDIFARSLMGPPPPSGGGGSGGGAGGRGRAQRADSAESETSDLDIDEAGAGEVLQLPSPTPNATPSPSRKREEAPSDNADASTAAASTAADARDLPLPAPKVSATDPAMAKDMDSSRSMSSSKVVFPPLEPGLQEEIAKLSLSTVSLPNRHAMDKDSNPSFADADADADEEIAQYALPREDPADYVSLGSLAGARESVSPLSLPRAGAGAGTRGDSAGAGAEDVGLAPYPANPAPALYGFFLGERDDIRDEYNRLEVISKEIMGKKVSLSLHMSCQCPARRG
jgi:hypothetical protein